MHLPSNDNAIYTAENTLPSLNHQTTEMEFYAQKCIESCKELQQKLQQTSDNLEITEKNFKRYNKNLTHIDNGLKRTKELSENLYAIMDDVPITTQA